MKRDISFEASVDEFTPLTSSNANHSYINDERGRRTSKYSIVSEDKSIDANEIWEFPPWGTVMERKIPTESLPNIPSKTLLNVFQSTAIAGNDLLGSVLYTTGIVCVACGQLAPLAMFLAVLAVYPFRKIFQEIGTDLPHNAGIYMSLLNSSSKSLAAFAASCSLVTCSATAAMSVGSATKHLEEFFGPGPVIGVCLLMMGVAVYLVLLDIQYCARVATVVFVLHLVTLLGLVTCAGRVGLREGAFWSNWSQPLPHPGQDLFYGYSLALLGLTGFETATNYIEEAGPFEPRAGRAGFEKALDGLYLMALLINPAISLLVLNSLELTSIRENPHGVLIRVADRVWGPEKMGLLLALDAVIVLAGGLLASLLGGTALIRQLALDRYLPPGLKEKSLWAPVALVAFGCGLLGLAEGDLSLLSGVFSLAFLLWLLCVAATHLCLLCQKPFWPRAQRQGWPFTLWGFGAALVGFIGVALQDPRRLGLFLIFLATHLLLLLLFLHRLQLSRGLLAISRLLPAPLDPLLSAPLLRIVQHLQWSFSMVFFTSSADLHVLNEVIGYVRGREKCSQLLLVHVISPSSEPQVGLQLKEILSLLDHLYPKMKIDLLLLQCEHGLCPQLIHWLSQDTGISPSSMFIWSPSHAFPYSMAALGGVRTIMKK